MKHKLELAIKYEFCNFFFQVLNNHGVPVQDVSESPSEDLSVFPHRVLIASEEQFKLFVLVNIQKSNKSNLVVL